MADTIRLEGARASLAPRVTFQSKLEGEFFRFRMAWNSRGQFWTLDLATADGTGILRGHAVREGQDMIAAYKWSVCPLGQLIARDVEGQGREPGRYAFRDTHDLVYIESA